MKGDRHEVFPEAAVGLQQREPCFRGWSTAATLRGVKFEEYCAIREALKLDLFGVHAIHDGPLEKQEKELLHVVIRLDVRLTRELDDSMRRYRPKRPRSAT